jgi:hypothetical protein
VQANYRWSKWLDTSSDTSTGQFADNSEPGKGAQNIDCLRCERGRSLFDIPHRFSAQLLWTPTFSLGNRWAGQVVNGWQLSAIVTQQSGRPFSVWNGAASTAGGDYNRDGGGGAVGGGFYDRPNAPATGAVKSSFNKQDFLNGLFPASIFPAPTPGNLGRNTFRGPKFSAVDLSFARIFTVLENKQIQFRVEAFNAFNQVLLNNPSTNISDVGYGTINGTAPARNIQLGLRLTF